MRELDPDLIGDIRRALAETGSYNPAQIYPGDNLWDLLGFDYSEDLDEFVMKHKLVQSGCGDLPYETLQTVGDFVNYVASERKVVGQGQ